MPASDEQLTTTELIQLVLAADPVGSGLVSLAEYIGFDAGAVKTVLEDGIPGQVEVVPVEELGKVAGIRPVLVTAASDTIYLGENADHVVVSIAAVPTAHDLKQVPAIGLAAREAAGNATTALETAQGFDLKYAQVFTEFGDRLDGVGEQLANLPDATKLVEFAQRGDRLEAGIEQAGKDLAGAHQQLLDHARLLGENSTKVDGILGTQTQHEAGLAAHGQRLAGLDQAAAKLTADLETATAAHTKLTGDVAELNATLGEHEAILTRVEADTTKLGADVTSLGEHLTTRVDQVFDIQARQRGAGVGGNVVAANASIVGALEAMRTTVEASASRTKGVQVRRALANADPHLTVLRGLSSSDTPLTASNADAIAGTVSALVDAVGAAGLSPESAEYKALGAQVEELYGALGLKQGPVE